MLVLIVLYDTYHIEVEASVHFGSFLYITGLDVIDGPVGGINLS